jgi:hypothetical protein
MRGTLPVETGYRCAGRSRHQSASFEERSEP